MKQTITHPLRSMLLVILAAGLMCSGYPGLAEVYKTVDESGKVTFTDQPAQGAEPVEIKEPNTLKPVESRDRQPASTDTDNVTYSVSITSPSDQQLFPNRLEPFTVTTRVTPALKEGHRLRLSVDGKVDSFSVGSFTVSALSIGEHTLQVAILDVSDEVVARSKVITIFARNPGAGPN